MREIRQSGSEGGGADQAALPTPIRQTVKYAARSKKYAAWSGPADSLSKVPCGCVPIFCNTQSSSGLRFACAPGALFTRIIAKDGL